MAAPVRRRLAPWLLLALWARVAAALRRWFLRWVRRPLPRLAMGPAPRPRLRMDDEDEDEAEAGAAPQLSSDELPVGLPNAGNTCFVNAVVQCLRATPGFVDRLVTDTARAQAAALNGDDEERAKQWHVADALCDLLDGVSPTLRLLAWEACDDEGDVLVGHSIVKERDPKARRVPTIALLQRFRQEASRCSYLIQEMAEQQEQQDAEVGAGCLGCTGWSKTDGGVLPQCRSFCHSFWSCSMSCSAIATSKGTSKRMPKRTG